MKLGQRSVNSKDPFVAAYKLYLELEKEAGDSKGPFFVLETKLRMDEIEVPERPKKRLGVDSNWIRIDFKVEEAKVKGNDEVVDALYGARVGKFIWLPDFESIDEEVAKNLYVDEEGTEEGFEEWFEKEKKIIGKGFDRGTEEIHKIYNSLTGKDAYKMELNDVVKELNEFIGTYMSGEVRNKSERVGGKWAPKVTYDAMGRERLEMEIKGNVAKFEENNDLPWADDLLADDKKEDDNSDFFRSLEE